MNPSPIAADALSGIPRWQGPGVWRRPGQDSQHYSSQAGGGGLLLELLLLQLYLQVLTELLGSPPPQSGSIQLDEEEDLAKEMKEWKKQDERRGKYTPHIIGGAAENPLPPKV